MKLEDDGLLAVEHPPQGSLSFQADYFTRRHPTTETGDIRDFFALTERYYQKLLARFYPEASSRMPTQAGTKGSVRDEHKCIRKTNYKAR